MTAQIAKRKVSSLLAVHTFLPLSTARSSLLCEPGEVDEERWVDDGLDGLRETLGDEEEHEASDRGIREEKDENDTSIETV